MPVLGVTNVVKLQLLPQRRGKTEDELLECKLNIAILP